MPTAILVSLFEWIWLWTLRIRRTSEFAKCKLAAFGVDTDVRQRIGFTLKNRRAGEDPRHIFRMTAESCPRKAPVGLKREPTKQRIKLVLRLAVAQERVQTSG